MTRITKGSQVEWTWGAHTAKGKVAERFTEDVTRTIKGSAVTRHADKDNPAYLIRQDDGDQVLKRGSELEAQQ